MSLISGLENSSALISNKTLNANNDKKKLQFYINTLRYMDEYHYYNYLKVTNPHYGFTFASNEIYFVEADISTKLELLLYFVRHKDDADVDIDKLEQIRQDILNDNY